MGAGRTRGAGQVIRVCFHGAESTGKSALAARLGYPWVPEYGRSYAEHYGTDFTMVDLLAIAAGQDAAMRAAAAYQPELLILDTDPLMTAAWAQMLFKEVPDVLLQYDQADHYLVFDADVPWVADGTRFFGTPQSRQDFAVVCEAMLIRTGASYQRISGTWAEREAQVRNALAALQA